MARTKLFIHEDSSVSYDFLSKVLNEIEDLKSIDYISIKPERTEVVVNNSVVLHDTPKKNDHWTLELRNVPRIVYVDLAVFTESLGNFLEERHSHHGYLYPEIYFDTYDEHVMENLAIMYNPAEDVEDIEYIDLGVRNRYMQEFLVKETDDEVQICIRE